MKKILFILAIFISLGAFSQTKTYKDSNTGDTIQRLLVNTNSDGITRLGFVIGTDTNWIENDSHNINIIGDTVRINGIIYNNEIPVSKFDGNRTVSRSGLPALNVGGETIYEWVNNYFFPFSDPSVSINSSVVGEIGNDYEITLAGSVTLNDETLITSGEASKIYPVELLVTEFTSSYSETIYWNPRQTPSTAIEQQELRYQAEIAGQDCECTVQSSIFYLRGVYPFLYGVSTSDFSTGEAAYSTLTKLVELQGDKTVTLSGSGYIYFAYPATYADLTSIIDQNGFEQIKAFTKTTANITSSGLSDDWTVSYKIYKLNNTTAPLSWTYQFIF